MANVLDFMEPGPLLSNEVVKPPIISKATVQRCLSKLSPHWTDEQHASYASEPKTDAKLEVIWGALNAIDRKTKKNK